MDPSTYRRLGTSAKDQKDEIQIEGHEYVSNMKKNEKQKYIDNCLPILRYILVYYTVIT